MDLPSWIIKKQVLPSVPNPFSNERAGKAGAGALVVVIVVAATVGTVWG